MSIITGDEKALTCAQGIGKKIAQRVILELKDKLAKGQTINAAGESYVGTGVTVIPENKLSEATAALAVLGYSQGEINLALKGIDLDGLPLEQVIKQALKKDGEGGNNMAKFELYLTGRLRPGPALLPRGHPQRQRVRQL